MKSAFFSKEFLASKLLILIDSDVVLLFVQWRKERERMKMVEMVSVIHQSSR